MENKSAKTPNPAEIKKKLEAIAGHPIDAGAEELIRLFFPAATFTVDDGSVTMKGIIFPFKNCFDATLLDVTASSTTGADGTRVLLITDFVCTNNFNSFGEPVNVLVTPRSSTPCYATMQHTLINVSQGLGSDVQITVSTWDATGAPAPNVSFDWRCRVGAVNQIVIQ